MQGEKRAAEEEGIALVGKAKGGKRRESKIRKGKKRKEVRGKKNLLSSSLLPV